jgi:hypothetical protein
MVRNTNELPLHGKASEFAGGQQVGPFTQHQRHGGRRRGRIDAIVKTEWSKKNNKKKKVEKGNINHQYEREQNQKQH